jgi:hypothetical protein
MMGCKTPRTKVHLKVLAAKIHGDIDYCGQCGKAIKDVPKWGFGWQEVPFLLFGEFVCDADSEAHIKSGLTLVVPFCSERCRKLYCQKVDEIEGLQGGT